MDNIEGFLALAAARPARPITVARMVVGLCNQSSVIVGDARTSTLEAMIASIRRGILMRTNVSWSIDDSRNKFQFGCERGRLIVDGALGGIVKNPNYRGISASFWRSLAKVGDASTLQVLGTPYCGKGEPSQIMRCGHASPACVFTNVDVFGGAE